MSRRSVAIAIACAIAGALETAHSLAYGAFDPLAVATVIADWDDAPQAFTTPATKVIVRRSEFGAMRVPETCAGAAHSR